MPVPPPVIKAVRPLSVSLVNIRIFPIVASALVDDAQALCHPARQAWPGANAARVSLARTGLLSSKTHCLADGRGEQKEPAWHRLCGATDLPPRAVQHQGTPRRIDDERHAVGQDSARGWRVRH